MSTEPVSVTAVVCSRDRGAMLRAALTGLPEALSASDEALVVDSGSRTTEVADAARDMGILCIRVALPGLSRARNAGLRHARTDVVAFTDDDCRPTPEWLERVRTHFADERVAFVTGRVAAAGRAGATASVLERDDLVRYEGAQDPYGIGHGANMAFRRSALVELGGFDERLGAGTSLRSGEDADMLYRCLAAGWAGVYDPAAVVSHDQWRSEREVVALRYGYGLGNGAFRAKAARRDPRAGLALLSRSFWRQGLAPILRAVRHRRAGALPGALTWTAGMVVGTVRGAFMARTGR